MVAAANMTHTATLSAASAGTATGAAPRLTLGDITTAQTDRRPARDGVFCCCTQHHPQPRGRLLREVWVEAGHRDTPPTSARDGWHQQARNQRPLCGGSAV